MFCVGPDLTGQQDSLPAARPVRTASWAARSGRGMIDWPARPASQSGRLRRDWAAQIWSGAPAYRPVGLAGQLAEPGRTSSASPTRSGLLPNPTGGLDPLGWPATTAFFDLIQQFAHDPAACDSTVKGRTSPLHVGDANGFTRIAIPAGASIP